MFQTICSFWCWPVMSSTRLAQKRWNFAAQIPSWHSWNVWLFQYIQAYFKEFFQIPTLDWSWKRDVENLKLKYTFVLRASKIFIETSIPSFEQSRHEKSMIYLLVRWICEWTRAGQAIASRSSLRVTIETRLATFTLVSFCVVLTCLQTKQRW